MESDRKQECDMKSLFLMDHVFRSPLAFHSTRPFKNAQFLLHFFPCTAMTRRAPSTIARLYFISFPYFFPSNHVLYNNWNRRRNRKERKKTLQSQHLFLFFSLLRLSTRSKTRWMSTLSSTKHQRSSRHFFLIMTRAAVEALVTVQLTGGDRFKCVTEYLDMAFRKANEESPFENLRLHNLLAGLHPHF